MTLSSGLNKSIGIAFETGGYGVGIAPTVHVPLVEESMSREVERLMSDAVIAGARVPRSQQWTPGRIIVGGDVGLELFDRSIGKFLRAMFGAVATTGPVSSLYTHTYSPGDLADDVFTLQLIRPDGAGTLRPFTYVGCMVESWEIACEEGKIATLGLTVISRDEVLHRTLADGDTTNGDATVTSATGAFGPDDLFKPISGAGIPAASYVGQINSSTSIELSSSNVVHTSVNATATASGVALVVGIAATAVSYTSGIKPMSFLGGSASIGGSVANVKGLTVTGANGLKNDRRFLGSGLIRQPKEIARRDYGGTIKMEFEDPTEYKRYVNGDEFAIGFDISVAAQRVAFTMNARYDGKTPTISGTELTELELPYVCVGTSTDASALTAVYTSSESTP